MRMENMDSNERKPSNRLDLNQTLVGNEGWMLFTSFFMMSMSASFIMLATMQVTNIVFGKYKALFMCILSGSIDSAAAVFLLFLVTFQNGYSLQSISLVYTITTTIFLLIVTVTLFPSKRELFDTITAKEQLLADVDDTIESRRRDSTEAFEDQEGAFSASFAWLSTSNMFVSSFQDSKSRSFYQSYRRTLPDTISEKAPLLIKEKIGSKKAHSQSFDLKPVQSCWNECTGRDPPISQSLKSPFFILGNLFMGVFIFRLWFFIGNVDQFLLSITDFETTNYYIKLFGYIQFTGFIFTPILGLMFLGEELCGGGEKLKSPEARRLKEIKSCIIPASVTVVLGTIFCILPLLETTLVIVPMFLLFTVVQGFMWAFMTAFYGIVFPPQHYSTLYCYNIVSAGVMSMMQYPMLQLTNTYFHGLQFYTNLIFLCLIMTSMALPTYLIYYYWREKKKLDVIKIIDAHNGYNACA